MLKGKKLIILHLFYGYEPTKKVFSEIRILKIYLLGPCNGATAFSSATGIGDGVELLDLCSRSGVARGDGVFANNCCANF